MAELRFYVASCTEEGGIYLCETNGEGVRVLQFFPVPCPMYLERKADTLYAVLRGAKDESLLVTYSLSSDGFIEKELSRVSTLGLVGCHLAVTDEGVFVANYTSGNVFRTPDLSVTHQGHSVHPTRQNEPHVHAVIPTPDGKYICATDLGTDTICVYDKDLRLVSSARVNAGHGPRHGVFSPCGKLFYCLCELTGELFVFGYQNGTLSLLHSVPTLPTDFTEYNLAAAIRLADDRLYVSHRGHNSIAVLDIAGEKPRVLAHVSCEGNWPRDFNLFGDLLIVTNEKSDNVTFFRLQGGIPHALPFSLSIPAPLCVL
ncbi:MAG: lactonase family protein [Clostridia bacterium]|nr:lactonase family protein [Clostridia bacterium]